MKQGQELLTTWFRRVWQEENAEAIDEMYAGGKVAGLGSQVLLTPTDFRQFHGAMLAMLAEVHITIDKCVEDDTWTSALCTLRAKNRITGTPVVLTGTVWCRIEHGKIQEAYNHFDFISLWEQLGLIPGGSFERALQGQSLG